jgi:AraC-like DNA-binding protein
MIPVILKDFSPSVGLQEYVVKYQVFRFFFEKEILPPVKFHAPRPEHCITFYLRDKQRFNYLKTETILTYPQCVINGMYTVPVFRFGGNDFWAIKVVLQPSTLYHLVATPLTELSNKFIDAEEVWGARVRTVCERLNSLDKLDAMIPVIETFLLSLVKELNKTILPIDKAADYLLQGEEGIKLNWLANQSCLSPRQFTRKFEERIGVNAKTFQRIIRFDRAFRMKNRNPDHDWLSIAIQCGYYDYQHLVKDYKEFTGYTPPAFYEIEKKSPERFFGLYES